MKSRSDISKETYDALEFASKQVCVPFGNSKNKSNKTEPKASLIEKDEYTYPPGLDDLFIELFGKEQFDKCPSLMDKIEFIGEHWDDLKEEEIDE